MASAVRKALNIALVQMKVTANKATNLQVAREKVLAAGQNGADVVVLPECFNSPYGVQHFEQYAEPIEGTAPGESIRALSAMAKDAQVYLVGGTIPEVPQRQLYNTCPIFNRAGHLLATHRKVHLFDIDVPGKMTFRESSVLHAGNHLTQFTTEWGPIGVGICYDLRFPEMAMIAARRGCIAMIYPAAFNITTGPVFFELLQRARAVDNLFFVATCSPARADPEAIRNEGVYPAWGHSSVVGPVGEVIATCDHEDTTVVAQLDLDRLDEARRFYPIYQQRRFDLYPDVAQGL
ncbi:carbon-nitrogen hydrolase [Dimargaris cristalligena]|uniref:Carbon-nitrogen hydrolase n=1 Tax=Dimargaris cristalligena TaxID=215637 RepID=A0A4P9ZNH4_9FUNG|nr:carbon-nitrogen hydrolase [Dimargaris cristalligena]|eukprot:RKP34887.1 carbon-nitrogen hydrolase [Dimargaris cristalligena]